MQIFTSRAPSVAAVHDLSCVGRCALTVVIPVLAAMGVQPCPLPTAVLSTHTGGYSGMAVQDLTDFMGHCISHWKALGLRFDAVYSGYLASIRQVETVLELIDWQRPSGALAVVDPVMGDDGRLYSSMPADMPENMRRLCAQADLITPNMTEAALIAGIPYSLHPRAPGEVYEMLMGLNAKAAIITSVPMEGGRWANACHLRGERGYWQCSFDPVPAHYPGTGDLFASLVTGALVKGQPLNEAMDFATRFIRDAVEYSSRVGGAVREGVQLEAMFSKLNEPTGAPSVEFIKM